MTLTTVSPWRSTAAMSSVSVSTPPKDDVVCTGIGPPLGEWNGRVDGQGHKAPSRSHSPEWDLSGRAALVDADAVRIELLRIRAEDAAERDQIRRERELVRT